MVLMYILYASGGEVVRFEGSTQWAWICLVITKIIQYVDHNIGIRTYLLLFDETTAI